ncbi:hypothetical protein BD410DRAFT_759554 [Rickenella mellea]|uniref:Ribosome biogenesis protein SLX9 n=1 Tax=Rickenella mellea TaxID=50990 RepID=A0A4Y7QL44_9AGAM|nr:hypothetical protein BD410DRAFT_759554 [Rickenella mellea]
MPKERRVKRTAAHDPSVRLHKRVYAVDHNAVEQIDIGSSAQDTASDILSSMTTSTEKPILKKKEKQQMKHEAFLRRLESTHSPYSKSHNRRLKRKAKEEIGGGLSDIGLVLDTFDPSIPADESAVLGTSDDTTKAEALKQASKARPGQIGAGKAATLSNTQRKRAMQMEKLRHPLILTTPEFAANPFQTIRTHAQNTLIKHDRVS